MVANPDGYDFTFTPGNRLWRKNLRDNNGDGQITNGDGVDPNRNFAQKWNYDDEGSSSDPPRRPTAAPARPPSPRPRPWTGSRSGSSSSSRSTTTPPPSCCCIPSAGRWRPRRPTTRIFVALSGTDDNPRHRRQGGHRGARRRYDPDLSAELYTTNGETNDNGYSRYKTLGWTPEMDVSDPDRGGGESVFEFQDSRPTCRTRSTRTCRSRSTWPSRPKDPANPVERLGIDVPDFVPATFAVSYGDPQTVEVNAKRELGKVRVRYQINGGATKSADTTEWKGGERFGGEGVYFHRLRGEVSGAKAGDKVKVWFESLKAGKRSDSFTYELKTDTGNRGAGAVGRGLHRPANARPTRTSTARTTSSSTRRR